MNVQTRDIPDLRLRAEVDVSGIDAEKRTVPIVWTTGAQVLRYSFLDGPFLEELSLDPRHVRMGRLQSGTAPFLSDHRASVQTTAGVIESAKIDGKRGTATVRFVREGVDPAADQLFEKIRDGIVRNVSVGYRTYKMEKMTGGEKETPVFRATDWEPMEVSAVAMGADPDAGTRAADSERHPCEFLMDDPATPESAQVEDKRTAVPFQDLPLGPDRPFKADEATKRLREWASSDGSGDKGKIDWHQFRRGFFWYDPENQTNLGGFKLPFADVINGKLNAMPKGVEAAGAVLQGGRGGVNIPEQDREPVKANVAKYYKKMGRKAPWERSMDIENEVDPGAEAQKQAEIAVANAKREEEIRAEAQKQERERVAGIQHVARAAGLDEAWVKDAIEKGTGLDEVRAQALEKLAERSKSSDIDGHIRVEMGTTERDKLTRAAKSALVFRLGMMDLAVRVREKAKNTPGPHMLRISKEFEDLDLDGGGEFRGFRAVRLAQTMLERAGVNTSRMTDNEIVGRALDPSRLPESMLTRAGGDQTTSDFAVLLENVMYKQLLGNYALADDTWRQFCGTTTVEDFRTSNRYRTGSFGTLPEVPEGEEFTNAPIPDGLKQTVAAKTYGRMLTLSRQAIVNDDMGAIMDTAGKFGRSTGLSIEVAVYALLNANSGLGAAFNGQSSFFHAAFGNVNATGAALSSQAIDQDRVVLASQKDISSNEFLNLAKYGQLTLLVPVGLGGQARVVNKNEFEVPAGSATSSKNQTKNMVQGLYKTIIDSPRLTDATRRYTFADPGDAAAIMVAFLNGDQTPFLEQKLGWRVDGVEWKLRFDFGAQFFDPKGAVTNAGA